MELNTYGYLLTTASLANQSPLHTVTQSSDYILYGVHVASKGNSETDVDIVWTDPRQNDVEVPIVVGAYVEPGGAFYPLDHAMGLPVGSTIKARASEGGVIGVSLSFVPRVGA